MSQQVLQGSQKKNEDFKMLLIFYSFVAFLSSILFALHASGPNEENPLTGLFNGFMSALTNPFDFTFDALGFLKYLFYYFVLFGLIGLAGYAEYERYKNVDPNASGHAKWTTNFKAYAKKYMDMINKNNNMILTKNIHLNMNSSKTRRNNNILVVGGSGSGKTRFMIKPNMMQANCSFVATDPKGELLQTEGEMLRKNGYKIKVFNLVDMKHSNSYNPFKYIRDDLGVLMMINCLIKNTNNGQKGGDPFWEKSETALLQALVFYLKDNPSYTDADKNFSNVMELLRMAEIDENANTKSALDQIFQKVETNDPNSIAVKQYKTFKMGAGKTLKSILISCAVRLTVFNLPAIQNLTRQDDLELEKMGDEKTALFVVIPAADDTYNFLVSMMYSQLFETLYYRAENECSYEYWIKDKTGINTLAIARKNPKGLNNTKRDAENLLKQLKRARITRKTKNKTKYYIIEAMGVKKEFITKELAEQYKKDLETAKIEKGRIKLPYPVRFLLDEFANIGQIPDFTKKLATMRQYEISCTIILQNLAQIKTMYKDDWESIVGNCDSFLFLGGQEQSTLEYISKMLGKKTVKQKSTSKSHGKGGGSISIQNTAQELMAVNELATMPKDECVLIINGMHPFYDKKYDLTEHPNFCLTGDSNSGNNFDVKKEIFNVAAKQSDKQNNINTQADIKQIAGQSKTMINKINELGVKNISEFKETVKLTRGKVVVNTHDNGDFNYNIE